MVMVHPPFFQELLEAYLLSKHLNMSKGLRSSSHFESRRKATILEPQGLPHLWY